MPIYINIIFEGEESKKCLFTAHHIFNYKGMLDLPYKCQDGETERLLSTPKFYIVPKFYIKSYNNFVKLT